MKIQLFEEIGSGARFVAPVLVETLNALHTGPAPHTLASFSASAQLELDVGALVGTPPDGAHLTLQARSGGAAFFPVFAGTVRVTPVDPFASRLTLTGTYRVPLGVLGEVADRTLLAGTAKRSLQTFLSAMRDELSVAVLHHASSR
jgi:hypothetical protein